tara:strand:- start:4378 stop:4581 length:204 start_codon:yes stop_codon:yes gene_type:complete
MLSIDERHLLKVGDIIKASDSVLAHTGVVVEIDQHSKVHVFWPQSGKISKSGKQWAELNFTLVEEYH